MKIIKKDYNLEQLNIIKDLAVRSGILNLTAEILYSRGYDTEDKIRAFLNPGKHNFVSPFSLNGMSEATQRIISARDNGETVVVYGDYDADGISATTILYKALVEFGVNASCVIPERKDGYGLSEGVLAEVLENLFPDLIITVDCGISAKSEVEYLKDLGVDVIVTDHHELPEELPDALIVSCKTKGQEYGFEYLSGAGVAYKLAYALLGERANIYLDLVAVATVADSMPLTGENRDLVYEGVELIKSGRCSKAINSLFIASGAKEVTASSLAYTIAPRINAAGRMGDAYSALRLFITDSASEREELVKKLLAYNVDRQIECEVLYSEAKEQLKYKGKYQKAILLYNKKWKSGLLGIVAARLTEEYRLPTILFSESDGALHGSARSLNDVNVYEAIASASEYLIEFGGHAQAAGVAVLEENFENFAQRVSDYILNNYSDYDFEKIIESDGEIESRFTLRMAKEAALFEPCGLGNKKPIFTVKAGSLETKLMKEGSTHLTVKSPQIDLVYFGGKNYKEVFESDIEKTILFESSISTFNGREYLKGYVKGFTIDGEYTADTLLRAFNSALNGVVKGGVVDVETIDVQSIIDKTEPNGFGTLFILTNPKNKRHYNGLERFHEYLFNLAPNGAKNAVLTASNVYECDISTYDNLVFLDKPLSLPKSGFKGVITVGNIESFQVKDLDLSREALGEIFRSAVKEISARPITLFELVKKLEYNTNQTLFAINVFKELGFIVDDGILYLNKTVKRDLKESKIYTTFNN